jgi:HlyD family secretion protein
MKPRRWLWPVILVTLVAAGLGYAFMPRAVPVDIVDARVAPLTVTVEDDGVTRVREVYVVSAPVGGRVLRIDAQVGDAVSAGATVLATLLPSDPSFRDVRTQAELEASVQAAEAAVTLAGADIRRNQAELDYAQADYERSRRLFAQGFVAEATMDRARREMRTREAALATARAALRQRESELRSAQAALMTPTAQTRSDAESGQCCLQVRAPVSGSVLRVYQESEAVVAAGSRLLEIGDPADIEIVVDLLSRDAVRVSPGDAVRIERWGGDGALNGRVRRIEPFGVTKVSALGIEEQRVNVIIDLTDPRQRWERLGHGYQIDAQIVLWQGEAVLQVPLSALFRRGDDWAVFRVEDGRALVRMVAIGRTNRRGAQVLGGLEAGDRVVAHPSDRIRDGIRVVSRPQP